MDGGLYLVSNETNIEKQTILVSNANFKFEDGNNLNLRIRPSKQLFQLSLGSFLVKSKNQDQFIAKPYSFYMGDQANKKKVCGSGVILDYSENFITHVI